MMILAHDMTKCEIGGHLGRHLQFLKRLEVDSWGRLICCRGYFTEHFLKFSACYEFVQKPNLILLAYSVNMALPWLTQFKRPSKKELFIYHLSAACTLC